MLRDMLMLENKKTSQSARRGSSPTLITAALSLAVLLAAIGMHLGGTFGKKVVMPILQPVSAPQYLAIEDIDHNGTPDWQDELAKSGVALQSTTTPDATSTDPLSSLAENVARALYGGYLSLKQSGTYSPAKIDELGASIAAQIRAPEEFSPHIVSELSVEEDVSEARVLAYRSDLRTALSVLVTDDAPEFELFAHYIESKDPAWLQELAIVAVRYREAEEAMLEVEVPKDAIPEHLGALNALGSYAAMLDRMSRFSGDALSAVALLKTCNDAEERMLLAFDALAKYYVRTVAQK